MPTYQTGKNVLVAYKAETTFNTEPAIVTGANQFRLTGGGLKLSRGASESKEIRPDGQSSIPRLGYRSVSGNYSGELSVGTYDDLFEALLRGTWASDVLKPGTTPTRRSFCFEEREQDIDVSQVFTGCRVSSAALNFPPNEQASVNFGIVGADMTIKTGLDSPFYTSPTVTTTEGLMATDATISLGGSAITTLTAASFNIDLSAKGEPVIGSTVTPDIFDGQMKISGSVSMLRSDSVQQASYLAETELALVIVLNEAAAGLSMTFTLPKIKFTDYAQAMGNDGGMIATLPFTAGYDTTAAAMISIARDVTP